jgi:acetyl esterase
MSWPKVAAALDPQVKVVLAAIGGEVRVDDKTPDEARALFDTGPPTRPIAGIAEIQSIVVCGADGPLDGRIYRPAAANGGGIVFFHGGGWVLGGLDTHDRMAAQLAVDSSCAVI